MLITYRNRDNYHPQNVFVDGVKAGHVEYNGASGWNAFDRDGLFRGYSAHKSGAGNILAATHERLDSAK